MGSKYASYIIYIIKRMQRYKEIMNKKRGKKNLFMKSLYLCPRYGEKTKNRQSFPHCGE